MNRRTASIIGGIGRTLVALGLLILAFAAFQLWGTGWQEARAQAALRDEFDERRARIAALAPDYFSPTTTEVGDADPEHPTTTAAPLPPELIEELAEELLPRPGEPAGRIIIPAIDVDKGFVSGTTRDDLRKGPGHYPDTPLPGQAGNTAIAGHRTTYGQPFHNLDLLEPGDEIIVETLWGTFHYEVMGHATESGDELGHFIVHPSQIEVVSDQGDNRLTLTACHPKYSAAQRIVVTAQLVSPPGPELPALPATESAGHIPGEDTDDTGESNDPLGNDQHDDVAAGTDDDLENSAVVDEDLLEESLGWNFEETRPTLLWGAAAGLVAAAGWLLGQAWKRWPAYVTITPFFLAALWGCFTHLDRMLPAL